MLRTVKIQKLDDLYLVVQLFKQEFVGEFLVRDLIVGFGFS